MAADYLTLAELKSSLSLTGETYADADLAQAITAASRAVDEYCGRFFYKDTVDATRKYTPVSEEFVYVDDLSAVPTSVTSQTVLLVAGTNYTLSGANALLDGYPYDSLRSLSGFAFGRALPDSVVVVGKFGWPAVPAQVKSAASILAARLVRRVRESPFGLVGIGFDGTAAAILNVDPDLRLLLSPFVIDIGPR